MKKALILLVFCMVTTLVCAQRTLLVEKIGTPRRYFYHAGDYLKLRITKQDTLLKGKLWSIHDSMITVSELRPFDVRLGDINSVYKRFSFPNKFGKKLCIGSAAIFAIIGINHLLNHEQVFTNDMYIISGSMLGAGLISISLGEKRCRTDHRWRIKILDMNIPSTE